MILLDIKHYIREHHQVSDQQLMARFHLSACALQGLMQPLIQQGHIQVQQAGCQTGSCSSCSASDQQVFTWLARPYRTLSIPTQVSQHTSQATP